MMKPSYVIVAIFAVMSLIAFVAFGIDKYRARYDRWRIPESTLLLLAFLGGAVGAFAGMRTFHHKTLHKNFTILVPLFALVQIGVVFWALGWI